MPSSSLYIIFIRILIFKTYFSIRTRCSVNSIILLYSKYLTICFCNRNEIHDNVCSPKRQKRLQRIDLSTSPWLLATPVFIKFSKVSGCTPGDKGDRIWCHNMTYERLLKMSQKPTHQHYNHGNHSLKLNKRTNIVYRVRKLVNQFCFKEFLKLLSCLFPSSSGSPLRYRNVYLQRIFYASFPLADK